MANAGCLRLLVSALLFRISPDRRRVALGSKDWPTEVAREWRTKLRYWLARNASIILRQRRKAIGNIVMVSAVEFIGRLVSGTIVLQRPQDCSTNDKEGKRTPSGQDFSRQPCHARMLRSQSEAFGLLLLCLRRICLLVIVSTLADHDDGLPSVLTILTFCWRSLPSLSSAAPNSRSTINTLP
ncbi:hypothetical protein BE61_75960 [Bradyrhizobium elkanii USDA 61]|nr:hypothetical protein BE61_75960 [Bradyrhizobium elkanii USDA 61]